MSVKIISLEEGTNDLCNDYIAFFPDSLRFFITDRLTSNLIGKIADGWSYEKLKVVHPGLSRDNYDYIKYFCSEKAEAQDFNDLSTLPRLVINISNTCNPSCKYCYAGGGSYGDTQSIMTLDTLKKILDFFFSTYKSITLIQLFGGEPTLNIQAINYTCSYIEEHSPETKIGIVTNGTLITPKLISLVDLYSIYVTVSLDCSSLHDTLRPFATGENSYDKTIEGIKLLHSATDQPDQIEVTYTDLHARQGLSVAQVIKSIYSDLGFSLPVHISPVCSDNPYYSLKTPRELVESIDDYFIKLKDNICIPNSFIARYLWSLKNRVRSTVFCGGGIGTIAVGVNGDVYPCFYFTGMK